MEQETNALGVAMTQLIRKTPDVCGGDACIGKRRIAVWMIVRDKQLGLSDEKIRTQYELPLTSDELQAAWKYYAEHREEIEQAIRDNEED
jgi:uncharacterized protein (DUF433 family)